MLFKSFFFSLKHFKGGKDAKECVNIILNQYLKFFKKNNISFNIIKQKKQKNFYKNILIKINKISKYISKFILHENGINKIIRKSPFKKDSVQTSYCIVLFYPIINKKKLNINNEKFKIHFCKSSKPGGQNVNKTNSCVRIIHIKTGISVKYERERSQIINKKKAFEIIKYKINKYYLKTKKILINTKINRIYFFEKSLVINKHPIKKTNKLSYILDGNIDFFYK
ncbi:peptide chain release factor-like protein [Candidatus Vidania fulgoroideorum]